MPTRGKQTRELVMTRPTGFIERCKGLMDDEDVHNLILLRALVEYEVYRDQTSATFSINKRMKIVDCHTPLRLHYIPLSEVAEFWKNKLTRKRHRF